MYLVRKEPSDLSAACPADGPWGEPHWRMEVYMQQSSVPIQSVTLVHYGRIPSRRGPVHVHMVTVRPAVDSTIRVNTSGAEC